jgi:hypothetical protein
MKTLALIVRRPDHSREAFRKHYEEIHSPLAMRTIMEGTTRYVKHHLRDELYGVPEFDVVSAFEYRDGEAAAALFARSEGPEGARIRADELSFMDKPRNSFFVVTEEEIQGAPRRDLPLLCVALVRGPEGTARSDFLDRYARDSIPALLGAVEAPGWCLQNRATDLGDARFDCMTQIHAQADRDLAGWARGLEREGCHVIVASVYEDETETPW